MTHDPEEQERPFVTWSNGKKDSENIVYYIGIFMLLFGLISWVLELF